MFKLLYYLSYVLLLVDNNLIGSLLSLPDKPSGILNRLSTPNLPDVFWILNKIEDLGPHTTEYRVSTVQATKFKGEVGFLLRFVKRMISAMLGYFQQISTIISNSQLFSVKNSNMYFVILSNAQ